MEMTVAAKSVHSVVYDPTGKQLDPQVSVRSMAGRTAWHDLRSVVYDPAGKQLDLQVSVRSTQARTPRC